MRHWPYEPTCRIGGIFDGLSETSHLAYPRSDELSHLQHRGHHPAQGVRPDHSGHYAVRVVPTGYTKVTAGIKALTIRSYALTEVLLTLFFTYIVRDIYYNRDAAQPIGPLCLPAKPLTAPRLPWDRILPSRATMHFARSLLVLMGLVGAAAQVTVPTAAKFCGTSKGKRCPNKVTLGSGNNTVISVGGTPILDLTKTSGKTVSMSSHTLLAIHALAPHPNMCCPLSPLGPAQLLSRWRVSSNSRARVWRRRSPAT